MYEQAGLGDEMDDIDKQGCISIIAAPIMLLLLFGIVFGIVQFTNALTSADMWFVAGFFVVCAVLAIALHVAGKIYEK